MEGESYLYKAYHNVIQEMYQKKTYEVWHTHVKDKEAFYQSVMPKQKEACLLSEANWMVRKDLKSGTCIGILVNPGDICWLDYGRSYNREMGFQHFGLVLAICASKALIVPLTSSKSSYQQAYDACSNPQGNHYLMRIGIPEGLVKESTLYLNDIRFINTARIIEKKGCVPVKSELFQQVQSRIMTMLTQSIGERAELS